VETISYFAVAPAFLGGGLPVSGWDAGRAPAARVRHLDGIALLTGTGAPSAGPATKGAAMGGNTGSTMQPASTVQFGTTTQFDTTQDAVAASDVARGFHLRGRPPV